MPKNGLQFKNDDLMKVLLRNDKAALSYANSHLYAYGKITNKRPNEQNLFILSHYFRLNMRKLKRSFARRDARIHGRHGAVLTLSES